MFDEPISESWSKRFGTIPPAIPDALAPFLAHRSVRRFIDEEIPDEVVSGLIGAAQSAATSSNLQSWSVISVHDSERRKVIAEACAHQKQVITAPLFLVFLADLHRIAKYAKEAGFDPDGLDTAEMYTVAVIDATLAAERLVCAAQALGYGICYIGALRNHPDQIVEALKLPDKTFGVFGLCVGKPAENARADIKPRLLQDQVWFKEEYPSDLDCTEYDARLHEFHIEQGMVANEMWSEKSAKRTMLTGMSGRGALLSHLQRQGLLKR